MGGWGGFGCLGGVFVEMVEMRVGREEEEGVWEPVAVAVMVGGLCIFGGLGGFRCLRGLRW